MAAFFVSGVGLFVLLMLLAVFTMRYRITERAVEVLMFGFPVRRIRLDDIEGIHRGGTLWNEHWTNFKLRNCVTLRRRSGLVRNFVITPDDPDRFIAEIEERLS